MRRLVAVSGGVAALCAVVSGQGDVIARLEARLVEASRRGGSALAALVSADYVDVLPSGTTRAARDVATLAPEPHAGTDPDARIRVFERAALVTGTADGFQGTGRARFLRVWARQGEDWTLAASHATWIGQDPARDAAPPLPEPAAAAFGYAPSNATAQAIWTQHQAVGDSWAAGDRERYRALLAPEFVRVAVDGSQFARDAWVARLNGPSPPVRNAHVAIRVFGDLAVLTYLNVDARTNATTVPSSQWVTRIFTRQTDGAWRLLLTQPTTARQQPASKR